MKEVAGVVGEVLRNPLDDATRAACRGRVAELMARFPVYPN
jgi:glycine/serine hydroxymethyltransferase